ncbi:MAG: hypothetical protein FJZ67_00460 [Bacteroidetes bacterium]|nr:hypothetical protein [Bacteroidota bacterium]
MRIRIYIAIVFSLSLLKFKAQNSSDLEKKWNNTQREIEFGKDPNKKEPRDWWSNAPHYVSEDGTVSDQEEVSSKDFEEQIKRNRNGSGKNSKKEMKETEMAEPPEFDPPDINEPDIDIDAPDPTKISQSTWKTILILLLFAAVITGLYFWLKKQNSNPKFVQEFDDDWNPEIITKSELDIRLENALINENYRECIRIYFTIILQLLIAQEIIKWKREKTNHEYLFEMKSGSIKKPFSDCIRIFDLVWYGEYELDKNRFEKIQMRFQTLLNDLNANTGEK